MESHSFPGGLLPSPLAHLIGRPGNGWFTAQARHQALAGLKDARPAIGHLPFNFAESCQETSGLVHVESPAAAIGRDRTPGPNPTCGCAPEAARLRISLHVFPLPFPLEIGDGSNSRCEGLSGAEVIAREEARPLPPFPHTGTMPLSC
eukprot:scaffold149_cov315-Pinguiococcus_pyrenoidosus.AAC.119